MAEEKKQAKLNPRQREFAHQYVQTGNATQSAIKAGYAERTARSTAQRMLTNVDIKSYIDSLLNKRDEKEIMTAMEALKRLTKIAKGDLKVMTVVSNADGYSEVEVPPDFNQQISAIKELLKRMPRMTDYDKLKVSEMQQKQAEKEIDIAIKKRKLEILNGTSEDTMDAVSELISKIDGTFKK